MHYDDLEDNQGAIEITTVPKYTQKQNISIWHITILSHSLENFITVYYTELQK